MPASFADALAECRIALAGFAGGGLVAAQFGAEAGGGLFRRAQLAGGALQFGLQAAARIRPRRCAARWRAF